MFRILIPSRDRPDCITDDLLTVWGIPHNVLVDNDSQRLLYREMGTKATVTNAGKGKFTCMLWAAKHYEEEYLVFMDDDISAIETVDTVNWGKKFSRSIAVNTPKHLMEILLDDCKRMAMGELPPLGGVSKTTNPYWRSTSPASPNKIRTNIIGECIIVKRDWLLSVEKKVEWGDRMLEDLMLSLFAIEEFGGVFVDNRVSLTYSRYIEGGFGFGNKRTSREMAIFDELTTMFPFFSWKLRPDGKGFSTRFNNRRDNMAAKQEKKEKVDKTMTSTGGLKLEEGYYASPRWTYEILDCAMPMTFDTYSNCAHQCLYCFSFFQRAVGDTKDDYLHHKVKSVNADRVIKMFTNPDEFGGQFANYIKKRMVLQWGGLSDGFDFYERKFGVSLKLLKFFREIDYPISVSTKGVWWVYDDRYREVVKDAKNMHWKYSIITANEEHVKKLEPGVPPSRERFKAMEELNKLGVGATTLRFRPFVLGTSDKCIDEMMTMAEDSGCYSVTTEFLTWESRASNTSRQRLDMMSATLGYDVWDFYQRNSARASGLLRLNYDLKRPYILEMKESAERHNLKFFVSDAHHKEESYHAGCCGLPETGPLSVVNKGQYAHAILIAKEKGFVRWSDIRDMAKEALKGIPLYQAEGFPTDSVERAKRRYQNMFDYMHDVWNTPNSWQSPNRYFGGSLVASAPDENGDIVYLYNKPFVEEGVRIGSVNELAIQLRMAGKPNADRFDEMTSDGTPFGHVAYPIYVISSGRWANATTMKMLDAQKVNYTLVIPEGQGYYEDKYPNADILVVPRSDLKGKGVGAMRQFVYDYCEEQGNSFVWMLDDDIVNIHKRGNKPNEWEGNIPFRDIMSTFEAFMSSYSNISLLGANMVGNDEVTKQFTVNAPVRGFMLVNLMAGVKFNTKLKIYEDIEFALHGLKNGYVPVVYNDYVVMFGDLPGGGANALYLTSYDAEMVNNLYPESTQLEMVDRMPPKLRVNWDVFSTAIRSRNVELLMIGQ